MKVLKKIVIILSVTFFITNITNIIKTIKNYISENSQKIDNIVETIPKSNLVIESQLMDLYDTVGEAIKYIDDNKYKDKKIISQLCNDCITAINSIERNNTSHKFRIDSVDLKEDFVELEIAVEKGDRDKINIIIDNIKNHYAINDKSIRN